MTHEYCTTLTSTVKMMYTKQASVLLFSVSYNMRYVQCYVIVESPTHEIYTKYCKIAQDTDKAANRLRQTETPAID